SAHSASITPSVWNTIGTSLVFQTGRLGNAGRHLLECPLPGATARRKAPPDGAAPLRDDEEDRLDRMAAANPSGARRARVVFVVEQNAFGRTVEVVILIALQRPEEDPERDHAEDERERDQEDEAIHGRLPSPWERRFPAPS